MNAARTVLYAAVLAVPFGATAGGAPAQSIEVTADDTARAQSLHLRLNTGRTRAGRIDTPFSGVGTDRLALPDDWTAAPVTGDMTGADPGTPRDLRIVRDALDAAWRRRFDTWRVEAGLNVQRRRGLEAAAGTFGHTGGNSRAALLPAPVDDEMREWRFAATWLGGHRSFRIGGTLGQYANAFQALAWQNPFSGVPGWGPGAGWPDGHAQLARAPDNTMRDLALTWAWRAPAGTAVTLDYALGRHEQDEPFLPYTTNAALAVPRALPRASLDGAVERRRAQARFRHPIADSLEFEARWRDERDDDRTPPALFIYPAGDTIDQAGPGSAYARWRLPRDHRRTRLDGALQWRAARRDRVRFEWGWDDFERAYSEVAETSERHIALEWRRTGLQAAHLRVERASRDAGEYRHALPWSAFHTDEYIATVAPELRFENHPLLRRFNLADRTRETLRTGVQWNADTWSAGLVGHALRDRYSDSVFGLTASRQRGLTADIGHALSDAQYLSVWASREAWDTRQDGRHFRGGAFAGTDWLDASRDWTAASDDRVTAAGAGWRHRAPWPNGEIGIDFAHTHSTVDVDVTAGPAITTAPLPRVSTRVDRVTVSAAHALRPNLRVRVALDQERWRSDDWATDGVGPRTVASVLGFTDPIPDRRLGWASLSVDWRF